VPEGRALALLAPSWLNGHEYMAKEAPEGGTLGAAALGAAALAGAGHRPDEHAATCTTSAVPTPPDESSAQSDNTKIQFIEINLLHCPPFRGLITALGAVNLVLTHNSPKYLDVNLALEKFQGFFPLNYAIFSFGKCLNY